MLLGPLLVAVLAVVWEALVTTMDSREDGELSPHRSDHFNRSTGAFPHNP